MLMLRSFICGMAWLLGSAGLLVAGWKLALPGWQYQFPADHGNHPGFQTEWWYFTGNLRDAEGRDYGYQLTFFRQGITPQPRETTSRFVVSDLAFAHFAVTEISTGRFHHFQEVSRGAYGEAGFHDGTRLAWIGDWECELTGEHSFRIQARAGEIAIDLELKSRKEPVFHGAEGVSQKSEGPGRASHYYSLTRLETSGTLTFAGEPRPVTGWSWFDHEWATNQLASHQTGWDWFSLQFEDGSELMLFQIRTREGERDPFSGGTAIGADGSTLRISCDDFQLEPVGRPWKSSVTEGQYPTHWRLRVPALDLSVEITAALEAQELTLEPISYWEGAVHVVGTRGEEPLAGSGYLEMTGYGSPIVGMQAAP